MNVPNPDERFDRAESTLNQLANSQRHLLTAQVLMNDRMDRAERIIQKTAETLLELADSQKRLDVKLEALVDSQKHTDSKLEALTDIVRQWIERTGNGSAGQRPS
jgi:peptidoglycan hydrolase CwlO-like protein